MFPLCTLVVLLLALWTPAGAELLDGALAARSKFQPQVADIDGYVTPPAADDREEYGWHGSISFNTNQTGAQWTTYCSCVFMEPQWCLSTYDCVKPLVMYEGVNNMKYRVQWKTDQWSQGVGYVTSFEYNANLGLGLVYLDRSPFQRSSLTSDPVVSFAVLASILERNITNSTFVYDNVTNTTNEVFYQEHMTHPLVDTNVTFLGMGRTSTSSATGVLRSRLVTMRNRGWARDSLDSVNYTWAGYSRPVSHLWHVHNPVYPYVLYTEPIHCVGDSAGPLVDSAGQVLGLLVGYPGVTHKEGGPFVYQFQNANYKYPSVCTEAADVFVDLTVPQTQEWIRGVIATRPGLLVTGPSVDLGGGDLEIRRGNYGIYTFAFAPLGQSFDEIHIPVTRGIEVPAPRTPEVFFNSVHGTVAAPDSVEYRVEKNSIVLSWTKGAEIGTGSGFHVYPPVPSSYEWSAAATSNATDFAEGVVTISLNLRAANDCTMYPFVVKLFNCSREGAARCTEGKSLTTPGTPGSVPSRCTQCNSCVPHSYPWTEIKDMGGRCLTYTTAGGVELVTCTGADNQKWMYNENGLLGHWSRSCLNLESAVPLVKTCDYLSPFLFKPTPVAGQAGKWTIETTGADYGAAYCLYSEYHWPSTWLPRKARCDTVGSNIKSFTATLHAHYYKCENDGYKFVKTHADMEPYCSCNGLDTRPESNCAA